MDFFGFSLFVIEANKQMLLSRVKQRCKANNTDTSHPNTDVLLQLLKNMRLIKKIVHFISSRCYTGGYQNVPQGLTVLNNAEIFLHSSFRQL